MRPLIFAGNWKMNVGPTEAREYMRAFFAAPNTLKQDEIAVRQLHALKQHHPGKLRLADVKQMFLQM